MVVVKGHAAFVIVKQPVLAACVVMYYAQVACGDDKSGDNRDMNTSDDFDN